MSAEGAAVARGRGRRRRGISLSEVGAALTSRTALECYGVLFGFLVMAVIITWPVFLHAQSVITGGGYGGDQTGYLWDYWYLGKHGIEIWGAGTQPEIGAPFGQQYAGGINATILTTLVPAWFAVKIGGPILAYNVVVISGLTLSAAAMYLLVRWLRLGVGPAIWAGAAFMFFPYEQIRASGHLVLAHLECLPIVLMAGLWWAERPSWRRALALAGGLLFCVVSNPYYGVMGAVVVVVVVIAGAIRAWRGSGFRAAAARTGEAAAGVALVVLLPIGLLYAASSGTIQETIQRTRVELDFYGARITDFVLPPRAGLWADLLGNFSWSNPGGERTNFVGWVTIILAIVALVLGWRARRLLDERRRFFLAVSVPLVLVLMWWSLAVPTKWFGTDIPAPSDWVFDAFPYLRAYARFVAPVMCVLLAMGATGLWLLVRNRSVTARLCVFSAALILTFVDLAPTVPLRSAEPVVIGRTQGDQVPVWQWLKTHDPGAVVYEMSGTPIELISRYYLYGQILHDHRLVNGASSGQLGYDLQLENASVVYPGIASRLAALGVKLVTIEPFAYQLAGEPLPDVLHPPPGFIPVVAFGDGSAIWRVAAAPADGVAVRRSDGWWGPTYLNGQVWRYLEDEGTVTVAGRGGRRGVYRVSFRANGYIPGRVYTLALHSPDGFVDRVRIGPQPFTTVHGIVHVTSPHSDIKVVDEGPPAHQISAIDARVVSIQTTGWDVTRVGR